MIAQIEHAEVQFGFIQSGLQNEGLFVVLSRLLVLLQRRLGKSQIEKSGIVFRISRSQTAEDLFGLDVIPLFECLKTGSLRIARLRFKFSLIIRLFGE